MKIKILQEKDLPQIRHRNSGSKIQPTGALVVPTAKRRSAWYMPFGKGWIFYSQPGHAVSDFENPVYAQFVTNMVIFKTPGTPR